MAEQTGELVNPQVYQPKETVPVSGEVVDLFGIQEEPDWFPFIKNGIEKTSPIFSVVSVAPGTLVERKPSPVQLVKTSPEHGRSFEIDLGAGVIWSDKHGIIYGSLGIKGNNLEDTYIDTDQYSPFKFKVIGLQDKPLLETAIKNSQTLRAAGVETEKAELIIKPKEVIVDGRRLTIEEFKAILLSRARQDIQNQVRRHGIFATDQELKEDDLPRIDAYLQSTDFYFSVRSLQVAERFRDLHQIKSIQDLTRIMSRVFGFVNQREKIEARQQNRPPQVFDAGKDEDIERYFTDYLPARLGANLAKLHGIGLYHDFLTGHNVSLVGSIYDLDSVKPQKEGAEGQQKDFQELLADLDKIFHPGRVPFHRDEKTWFQENLGPRIAPNFFEALTMSYLEHLPLHKLSDQPNLQRALDLELDSTMEDGAQEMAEYLQENRVSFDEALAKEAEETGQEVDFVEELQRNLESALHSKLWYLCYENYSDIPYISDSRQMVEAIQNTAREWIANQVALYLTNRGLTHEDILSAYKKLVEAKMGTSTTAEPVKT
ncbi:hypothetical protein A3D81_00655 [Candidatus Curtissbacteria bacterium RIFCSPHIGHO2_02_FULL_40_17]|uniref:Uncharacterized protein n=2 Tax=Candidatus Curtissiibacteriota TaxID=1752717 RepID=A0A1F5GG55_9BACT|nr:MAG: hypothetical protein A3D81_00655 [Candidatus Curtissbacteria bacterium RIFCSPHIGHO2_02_FULL_40_17]OGE04416.1 MAG: hypothetical protein A3F45_00765 [Candidatus Curtissbacteria bacterium RIFCSPHIGHO2_12_FULL_41_17]